MERTSSARRKSWPATICWPGPRLMVLRPLAGPGGTAMELFTLLFGDLLAFVYHCFDRIVIYGYLSGLSRPAQVVHFFRNVVGVATVSKEVLSGRTADYQAWVEAYARNHRLPIEWAEKGVRKEDHVLPWQRRMAKQDAYGVYFIFKSMEQGATFRVSACRNTPPRIPITGSWRLSAAVSRIIISTFVTRCSAQWLCGWPRSSHSRPATTSMVTVSSSRS